jgi:8-oxo-dGTP diphosphatase
MGTALNDSAFRRKISDLKIIEEVPETRSAATAQRKRPAQLYRRKGTVLVEFDRTV